MLGKERVSLKERFRAREAKEQEVFKHRELFIENVRTHVLSVLVAQGFEVVPRPPADQDFPLGRLTRFREHGVVDLAEIQFLSHATACLSDQCMRGSERGDNDSHGIAECQ